MKTKALALVSMFAIGLALGLVWLNADRGGEQPMPPPPVPVTATEDASEFLLQAPSTGGDASTFVTEPVPPENLTARQVDELIRRGFIPAEYRDLWLDPDYQQRAEAQFNVIPKVPVATGEPCIPLDFGAEIICWNEFGYHPYLTYDVDQLRSMATTDAAAAEALVFRLPHENAPERMHFALQASRLSGKSGPIMRFAYSFTPDENSPDYREQMFDRYAIAVAGESLGYPYRLSRELELRIRREFDLTSEEFRDAFRDRRVTLQSEWGESS